MQFRALKAAAGTDPALIRARRLNATITCASAAPYYGLATLGRTADVHLAVPRSRGSRPSRSRRTGGTVIHRESRWVRAGNPLLPLAPVVDVLSRVLRCADDDRQAITMIDSALNQRLTTVEEIDRALAGPGRPAARGRLLRCDSRSRSATETVARLVLSDAGITVRAGVVIAGVGEVDLLAADRVVVECDGFAYHSGRAEFRNDRRRDRELVALGYLVVRFTSQEVLEEPGMVVDAVRRALAAPLWRD